jgi:hypothetical protein
MPAARTTAATALTPLPPRTSVQAIRAAGGRVIAVDDLRDFPFASAVRLWGTGNPAFFRSMAVEKATEAVLAEAAGETP